MHHKNLLYIYKLVVPFFSAKKKKKEEKKKTYCFHNKIILL